MPTPAVEVASPPSAPANIPAGMLSPLNAKMAVGEVSTPTSAGVELREQRVQGAEALPGGVGGDQRLVGVGHGRLGNAAAAAASDGGGGSLQRGGGMGDGGGLGIGERGEAVAGPMLAGAGAGYESANAPREASQTARGASSIAEGGVAVSASVLTHCRITIFVKTLTGKTISLKGIHPGNTHPPQNQTPRAAFP